MENKKTFIVALVNQELSLSINIVVDFNYKILGNEKIYDKVLVPKLDLSVNLPKDTKKLEDAQIYFNNFLKVFLYDISTKMSVEQFLLLYNFQKAENNAEFNRLIKEQSNKKSIKKKSEERHTN